MKFTLHLLAGVLGGLWPLLLLPQALTSDPGGMPPQPPPPAVVHSPLIPLTLVWPSLSAYLQELPALQAALPAWQQPFPLAMDSRRTWPDRSTLAAPEPADRARFEQLMHMAQANTWHQQPFHVTLQTVAEQLLDAPYRANVLEQEPQETLVASLSHFDCVVLVETVLALARGITIQDYRHTTFVQNLEDQRYHNGQRGTYCSRLHYFSEWIADNQQRGTVEDLTLQLGGVPQVKPLNFMSQHRQQYAAIAQDDQLYACIQQMEAQISQQPIHYIPTAAIAALPLQAGDIVAIATDLPGLDVTHTGLVYQHASGTIGLLHASPAGRVTIAPDLQRYVERVPHSIGIMVARPRSPQR